MLKKLMQRSGRYKLIRDRQNHEPYLERYYLLLRDRKRFPFNVFLHKFLKGDLDDLHDHPWPYFTVILHGGYWEHTPQGKFWRKPGHFRFCSSRSVHRIELDPGITCWTLFFPGPRIREWGFLSKNRWIEHEEYFEQRKLNK
jgi:hypothetical protein